jgi:hypothetical protein
MPTYECECRICGKKIEYWETIANRNKVPSHCGKKARRVLNTPMIAPMFQEYRAIGIPGKPWIKTKQQHINTLREHNKIEVGTDKSMMHETNDEAFKEFQQNQVKEMEDAAQVMKEVEKVLTH